MVESFSFIYFSTLLKKSVRTDKKHLGRVMDFVADIKPSYPDVSGIICKKRLSRRISFIPLKHLVIKRNGFLVKNENASCVFDRDDLSETNILLGETFIDRQIIDISGSKVVRVSDIHLISKDNTLWVVHMDIGFSGFLRRLGWFPFFNALCRFLIGRKMTENLISWKYVQPVTSAGNGYKSLLLKVSQKSLKSLHPADIAEILVDLGLEEKINLLKSLDSKTSADILENLPLKNAQYILGSLDIEVAAGILAEMEINKAVDCIIRMHHEKKTQILKILPGELSKTIRDLSAHSEKIAGSIMTTEFITVKPSQKVRQALQLVRENSEDIDAIHHVYVVDNDNRLIGIVSLRDLLLTRSTAGIRKVMNSNVISVTVDTSIDEVADCFLKYKINLIPVVDEDGRICGVVSMLDALFQAYPVLREDAQGTS